MSIILSILGALGSAFSGLVAPLVGAIFKNQASSEQKTGATAQAEVDEKATVTQDQEIIHAQEAEVVAVANAAPALDSLRNGSF